MILLRERKRDKNKNKKNKQTLWGFWIVNSVDEVKCLLHCSQ
jgi:hypothetical protein